MILTKTMHKVSYKWHKVSWESPKTPARVKSKKSNVSIKSYISLLHRGGAYFVDFTNETWASNTINKIATAARTIEGGLSHHFFSTLSVSNKKVQPLWYIWIAGSVCSFMGRLLCSSSDILLPLIPIPVIFLLHNILTLSQTHVLTFL